jgi:hypothetical protein
MKNLKARHDLWLFVLGPTGFFSFAAAAHYIHPSIAMLALVWGVICGIVVSSIKCPYCSRQIDRHVYHIAGVEFGLRMPFVSNRCPHCGMRVDNLNEPTGQL